MRNRLIPFVVTFLLFIAAAPADVEASAYEITLCPPIVGQFLLQKGQLWIAIVKEEGKPVKRSERIANPLDERSHEVLAKRGNVKVEVHQDKKGGLFVHWGTLADDKE
jgi:hypothetical protein